MRVRFLSVSYRFGSSSMGLDRRYQELREAMVSAAQGFAYLHGASDWRPPMDVHETDDAIVVKLEVAGVQEDDIELSLYPNALVVHGIRRDDAEHSEVDCFHAAQVRYGLFHADVALPAPIQQEDVTATYRDGFLRIRLPKATPGAPGNSGERSRPSSEGADSSVRWQAHAGVASS
ncbi:MAG TPA: Hsp20/alpha crystallin family protein [Ktedonobacterales bacterium]|nr:Hsp20/alpha crystallin family protein [Ktedonobacterales bacterium]HEX5570957.1 Hsp20/alpha crystallin family protein [Ktedonobacterales bacterium]